MLFEWMTRRTNLTGSSLVHFLGEHIPDAVNNAYGQFVGSQAIISKLTEEYLYYEYLEAYNQPYWFMSSSNYWTRMLFNISEIQTSAV